MERNTRQLLVAFVWAGLLIAPRLLLAGPFVPEGQVATKTDMAFDFEAEGWLSIAGQPPSPDPLAAASSPVKVVGDGAHWEFFALTLRAEGGLDALVAKQVSLQLSRNDDNENKHLHDPHVLDSEYRNTLPGIETRPKKDVALGAPAEPWMEWADDEHRDTLGIHKDYYGIGGKIRYTKGGAINTLAADDAWVRAGHEKFPEGHPKNPKKPPGQPGQTPGLTLESHFRFDAALGLLTIQPSHVVGGVSFDDPVSTAWVEEMNFHFNGQDTSGKWLFGGGHFALSTPSGEIVIQSAVDELAFDQDGGFGVLNRGGAVDGSQGTSPFMNQLYSALAGDETIGHAGAGFAPPQSGSTRWATWVSCQTASAIRSTGCRCR